MKTKERSLDHGQKRRKIGQMRKKVSVCLGGAEMQF